MRIAADMGKELRGIAPDAITMLQEYDWPGNVRELQNAVERAVILSTDAMLSTSAFDAVRYGLSQHWSGPTPRRSAIAVPDVPHSVTANSTRQILPIGNYCRETFVATPAK